MFWKGMVKIKKQSESGAGLKDIGGFEEPFALYVHIPFCIAKCNYCDFFSRPVDDIKIRKYLVFLKKEIELYADRLENKRLKTIYFGGGTPSLLKPDWLAEIMELIITEFSYPSTGEITLEANPSSLTRRRIKAYNKVGINRLSLGVQSFCDQELDFLGRLHNSKQAITTIENVAAVYSNYNLDFIFAIPEQKLMTWRKTLEKALDFLPPHLSLYNLQIEEDTPLQEKLKAGKISAVSEELDAEMYLQARKILKRAGYRHYEISNFACPGFESRHNKIYWLYQPYLGLGPAAHSFSGKSRFYNVNSISKYIKHLNEHKLPVVAQNFLSRTDLMFEMVMMGLRLMSGIEKNNFNNRFKVKIEDIYQNEINTLIEQGLLLNNEEKLYLTEKGLLFANRVFREFLPS